MARITIGNTTITGYVNLVAEKRIIVGTGSYTSKTGEKVFKESVTVFLEDKYDGVMPNKGDYVKVQGDLVVTPRKDNPEQLNGAFNVRFGNQLQVIDAPVRKTEAAHDDI